MNPSKTPDLNIALTAPFAGEAGAGIALAMFMDQHRDDLTVWLEDQDLPGDLLDPWIHSWLEGQNALARVARNNRTEQEKNNETTIPFLGT
jgi:hypothetical protein